MFLGSFDLSNIVGSPLGMAAQVSPAAKAAQMSPANQVFGAVTGGDAIQNALSSLPAQQALSSLPDIDFNSPVQGVTQGSVGGGILENRLGLEFLKNIFDRGNLQSPPTPEQRVIQNAPMQQFNNPANVRPTGLLGGVPAPSFPGAISDGELNFIVQQDKLRQQQMQPQTLTTPIGSISDQERMNMMQMQRRLANEGLKAFPGAISDGELNFIIQQDKLRQQQMQPMGLLGRY